MLQILKVVLLFLTELVSIILPYSSISSAVPSDIIVLFLVKKYVVTVIFLFWMAFWLFVCISILLRFCSIGIVYEDDCIYEFPAYC